jgi:hypothetical protein
MCAAGAAGEKNINKFVTIFGGVMYND